MQPFGKLIPGPFDDPGWLERDAGTSASADLGAATTILAEAAARRGNPRIGVTPVTPTPVTLPTEPASPTPFTIAITWDSSVAEAPAGFTSDVLAAVNFLETQFTDPVTININVGYEEIAGNALGNGDLGESLANMASVSYANLIDAVAANATTATDASVVASLPATNPVSHSNDWVTTAQAKALGLPASELSNSDGSTVDGSVGFGPASEFTYGDTNAGGTVQLDTYDFFGTVVHEITEVMGRQLLVGSAENGLPNSYTLLDLLHWSAPGSRDFSQFTPGYFSPNGGVSNLGAFNTLAGGDAGDWASSVAFDPFDAFASPDSAEIVSANDLTVMDAIGWKAAGSGGSTTPVIPVAPTLAPVFPPVRLPLAPVLTAPFFPVFSPFSPFLPATPTTPARPTNVPGSSPPTGFSFVGETKYLAYAEGAAGLSPNGPLASVSSVGGTPGDIVSYALTGTGASSFNLVATSDGAALLAGSGGVTGASGGAPYPLTVTATDTTAPGSPSVSAPVNVVVGAAGSDVITVSSLPGIVATAPTFLYGLGGNDTIDGTGMSGTLYFDGGSGGDTMTGGSGINVYEYAAAQDSSGSAMDVITNFNVAVDLIDLTGVGGLYVAPAALDPAATTIAAGSVGWVTSGANTLVYANTSGSTEALSAASLTIALRGAIPLTGANFAQS